MKTACQAQIRNIAWATATDVGSLANFLREEDTNTKMNDNDPRDRGDHIAASSSTAD